MNRIRLHRVFAIVIRQRDLAEADRIITLLTKERGKVSAVAKGIRKTRSKLAGGLQLFSHAQIQLATGRSLYVITQVQPINIFLHLREEMPRFTHASYLAELMDALVEEESPDPSLFEILRETFTGLDKGGDVATLTRGCELKLLARLGYGPEVEQCVACGVEITEDPAGFSAPHGGIVCKSCLHTQGEMALSLAAIQGMRDLIALPVSELAGRRLARSVAKELERAMRSFVDYQISRPLRSAQFLNM